MAGARLVGIAVSYRSSKGRRRSRCASSIMLPVNSPAATLSTLNFLQSHKPQNVDSASTSVRTARTRFRCRRHWAGPVLMVAGRSMRCWSAWSTRLPRSWMARACGRKIRPCARRRCKSTPTASQGAIGPTHSVVVSFCSFSFSRMVEGNSANQLSCNDPMLTGPRNRLNLRVIPHLQEQRSSWCSANIRRRKQTLRTQSRTRRDMCTKSEVRT